MKTIGIKLADGSFYPVLQEGSTEEVVLDLTTANNNQTKIMVDLYRSRTASMDDAEYVDSLQIENLNEHPNGEPDISFTVSLDENNELHAKIVDPETGAQSNSTITLVSRTIEERLVTDDYKVEETPAPAEPQEEVEVETESEPEVEVEPEIDEEAAAVAAMATGVGLIDASETSGDTEDFIIPDDATKAENNFSEDALAAFGGEAASNTDTTEDLDNFFDNISEESEPEIEEESVEIPEYRPEAEETVPEETPAEEETAEVEAEPFVPSDLPDFSDTSSTDLPDFSDDFATEPTESTETTESDPFASTDLPDFPEEETAGDFSTDDDFNFSEDLPDDFNLDNEPAPAAGGISFTGLYDKETELGESADYGTSSKTKKPVIICVVCAIICLIAVALVLFVLPTQYNLIKNGTIKTKPKAEKVEKTQEPVVETPVVESIPAAKEDEIVIIEKAEEVVPLPPPAKEEKAQDIIYKIKWGDTLWDISDTYYKNPWRYTYIARFNGIPDPDYIVSGTFITIPAE